MIENLAHHSEIWDAHIRCKQCKQASDTGGQSKTSANKLFLREKRHFIKYRSLVREPGSRTAALPRCESCAPGAGRAARPGIPARVPPGPGRSRQPGCDTSPARAAARSSGIHSGAAGEDVPRTPCCPAPCPPPRLRSPARLRLSCGAPRVSLPSGLPLLLLPGPGRRQRGSPEPQPAPLSAVAVTPPRPRPAAPPAPRCRGGTRSARPRPWGAGHCPRRGTEGGRAPPELPGSRHLVHRTLPDLQLGPPALSPALSGAAPPGRPRPRRGGQHSPPAGPRRSPPRRAGLLRSASPPPPACLRQPLSLR